MMDTIIGDATSGRSEGLRQRLDELRRQNARMARSIRRQRWALAVAGVVCLVVAVGGPVGFRTARAQPVAPGVPVGLATHLTKVGRYLIGVHNISYAFRSQNGAGVIYFTGTGRDQPLGLNADETAQLYATVVR